MNVTVEDILTAWVILCTGLGTVLYIQLAREKK